MARIKTQSAKSKGRELQKYIAERIETFFELEDGDCVSCSMGAGGEDIRMSPAARKKMPVSIECKATTATPGKSAIEQARYNAKGNVPLVVWKPRGEGPQKSRVMLDFEDLLKLIKFYKGNMNENDQNKNKTTIEEKKE